VRKVKTSKYEQQIIDILKKENIMFEREKTFKGLGSARAPYRFDFYIPSLNTCCEIQGEQHYRWVKRFHKTWADFKRAQERDREKIAYCLRNGITYCAVPYWKLKDKDFNLFVYDGQTRKVDEELIAKSKWHNDEAWQIEKSRFR
jgi:hypothetical protein